MSEKRKKSFISGAVVLAAGSLIAKFLGIFFRIPVINILGDYGNGLYEYAYPLYNTFLAISTTGLPIAISKMVSEKMSSDDYFGAYRIFDVFVMIRRHRAEHTVYILPPTATLNNTILYHTP